ncbi:hypothetical protein PF005_g14093 [Phytophthora fragariae]|nr:hypothetical protein PF009_g13342 [Phytophthora fragariae]KAE9203662.1 hypothetical protein PF005_g14093 [Phytophthora fragariae]KAE9220981.1 hypothetical protein PF002_g15718 [Phytophthora fragariae]
MRSQEPESGTIIGTAKCGQLSEVVGGLGGGASSQKPLSWKFATKGTERRGRRVRRAEYLPTQHAADDESGEYVECSLVAHAADDDFGEYVEYSLATHGADDEPGEYPECSLATHRTNDLVIWTSDRTEFRGEFEAEDGSDCPSRLSSRVAVGQAPEAYVRVAKFGVGQENFIRSTSGS